LKCGTSRLHEVFFINGNVVGFEDLSTVSVNVAIFWDTAPCSPYRNRRFGRTYRRKSAEQETSSRRYIPEDELSKAMLIGNIFVICLTDSNELFFVVILVLSYLLVSLVPY
jgi:hypothetical protein